MWLFCVKTIMIEFRNFELAHLKKEEEEKQFWLFDNFLVQYFYELFVPLGIVLALETLEDEWCIVVKALTYVYFFWDFETCFHFYSYHVLRLSYPFVQSLLTLC